MEEIMLELLHWTGWVETSIYGDWSSGCDRRKVYLGFIVEGLLKKKKTLGFSI